MGYVRAGSQQGAKPRSYPTLTPLVQRSSQISTITHVLLERSSSDLEYQEFVTRDHVSVVPCVIRGVGARAVVAGHSLAQSGATWWRASISVCCVELASLRAARRYQPKVQVGHSVGGRMAAQAGV